MDSGTESISSMDDRHSYGLKEADQNRKLYNDSDDKNDSVTHSKADLHGTLSHTRTRELSCSSDLESQQSHDINSENSNKVPHSLFTYNQKWMMVGVLTMCGFWSSLGSPIYYPALKQLEKQFDVDENMVNVTVVVYLIFQGLSPTFCGGLADLFGRRPVILTGMLIYTVASIGLACSNSYGVIVFLRCLQSAGISPTISISSGAVGDFTVKSERGTFVGAVSGLVLLGQAFGSLIGAALAASFNWRAIFWFLTIGCGVSMMVAFFVLPETKRTIVGNLSIRPNIYIIELQFLALNSVQKSFRYDNPDTETLEVNTSKYDPIAAFKILASPEIFLSLLPGGMIFAQWTLMLSAISSELSTAPYNYKLTIIGVCYLPAGIGGLLGSLITGRVIDYYYKRSLRKFEEDKMNGIIPMDAEFNAIKIRLTASLPQILLSVIVYIIFGWCLGEGEPVESMLIVSFFCSFCTMSTLSTSSTLLVDLYPGKSSTATSCFNFIRCSLSAMFMGCFADMKAAMTLGGTFTFLSGIVCISIGLLYFPMYHGMEWRNRRALKSELKAKEVMDTE
ncbi:hypothetical protein TPHA_0F01290 [Tetrapisispora phaffii CBS 4417]|uniref:Major facilitator superfamily (MFS) profile domain-containing protein n=1 Tax=Tetrapisispora phaffii (strain ATCC 24235 / CBS 4417 / NBRC 1672 / NRRL Y-8282 / UCD 70-5) TaxID=1071381 RepID=G8BV32_TETPH|nr:hypothetical protein TPHA_0F01290 [Tetrapisispora phaffii CBS 4417]CCE63614.1 hypothetical protein TPHA_0F01290 [Tetrapisispora phaffii CBS 4417]